MRSKRVSIRKTSAATANSAIVMWARLDPIVYLQSHPSRALGATMTGGLTRFLAAACAGMFALSLSRADATEISVNFPSALKAAPVSGRLILVV
jgi:hypothetical protein